MDAHEPLAVVDPGGPWTRAQVQLDALAVAEAIGRRAGERVASLCTAGHDFLAALLGSWESGSIAVPLHPGHPDPELAYFLDDAGASVIVCSAEHEELARRFGRPVVVVAPGSGKEPTRLAVPAPDVPAILIYTSGTTGKPKGAVHTHGGLGAQIDALVTAWRWTSADRILLVLPLHHVHGIVNVCLCAWAARATCEAPGGFDAEETWDRLASGDLTLFMAVPTIYARLIATWEAADGPTRARWSSGAARLRLMVSGSAALPVPTLERWRELTGHELLERYGMTEFGMALSNSLGSRVPGHVGEPLPGIEVRLVDEDGNDAAAGESGELLVRGRALFREYWGRPAETADAFVDGWFRTGDVAVHDDVGYRLLGRSSVDIIKSGGEKVSALEIEDVYRTHPDIVDCAVVGVPDAEWGERVAMVYVGTSTGAPEPAALRAWGKERLAAAKVPTRYLGVDELPRNTIGKVTKPPIVDLFGGSPNG